MQFMVMQFKIKMFHTGSMQVLIVVFENSIIK